MPRPVDGLQGALGCQTRHHGPEDHCGRHAARLRARRARLVRRHEAVRHRLRPPRAHRELHVRAEHDRVCRHGPEVRLHRRGPFRPPQRPHAVLESPRPWRTTTTSPSLGNLLDHLESTLCIDTAHVFSTGMSNGAQMSSLLACRMPERITAIAAGLRSRVPRAVQRRAGSHHGLPRHRGSDPSVRRRRAERHCDRQPAVLQGQASRPGCPSRSASTSRCGGGRGTTDALANFVETRISHEVRKRTWQRCKAATVLYIVDGGGHAWPGKPVPQFEKQFGHATTDIDASTLMFQFFFDRKS